MKILIKNGTIVTLGDNNKVIKNGSLLIEDDKIKRIYEHNENIQYDKLIDATNRVVMPGFINCHMHFYSTFARGLGKANPSKNFVEVLENLWWRLDKKLTLDDCYYSAIIPLIDSIKKGTTTLIDHHASPFAISGSLETIAKAVKVAGLRASLCYEVSDRDGKEKRDEGLKENQNFIKRVMSEKNDFIRALFGLHAAFTLSDETLAKAGEMAHELDTGFHIHVAEALSDEEFSMNKYKMRVVERLNEFGILGDKTIAGHCVHIDEKEMDILKDTKTNVVHNPQSNMNNAVGTAKIIDMINKGIRVGLGTDAMTVNMCSEVRTALWLSKLAKNNPSVGFVEVLSMLLNTNAKIADTYFNAGLGELKEGNKADVILIDYIPPTPLDEQNFLGHFGFGIAESHVDTTIVDGKILMENKKLKIDVDEEMISAKSRELAQSLWGRF